MRLAALVAGLLLAACVTGDQVKKLTPDMNREQVIATMGAPDGVRREGSYEALTYANRLMSGASWDRADYFVILRDGRVVEYGVGEVRQSGPPNAPALVLVQPVR